MKEKTTKLLTLINKNKVDAILVSSVPNIIYLTGYSGFSKEEREAYLFIVAQPQGLTHKTPGVFGYIITDGRYSEAVSARVRDFKLIERFQRDSLKKIFEGLSKKHAIKKLGIEEDNITVAEHKLLASCFNDLNHFSINSLRAIKDQNEIETIEKACVLGDKAFDYILNKLKKGVTEKEIAFELEYFIKKNGAELSFPTIVAFGKNSSVPHHQTSGNPLATSDKLILLDFGVKLNNYCSDMTRTVFFGKPTSEQKKMYETVLDAQKKAIEYLESLILDHKSIKATEADKVARDYIVSQGYPTIPHSLGHGVGLEIHEAPFLSPKSKDELKPGMVFSIEPGIYIPGIGGVRIEDLIVLETKGPCLLTKSPKELIEL